MKNKSTTDKFICLEELLDRKNELASLLKGEKYRCTHPDLKSLDQYTINIDDSPISIKNAKPLMKSIYSESIKFIQLDTKFYPFVSEIGLIADTNKLIVDKWSIETLQKIVQAADPYWNQIKIKKMPEYLTNANWPGCFASQIIYDQGVFLLPICPEHEYDFPGHTHFFNIHDTESKFSMFFPSPDDMLTLLVPSDGVYFSHHQDYPVPQNLNILAIPMDFKELIKGNVSDYSKQVNKKSVIGSVTKIDENNKLITLNFLTG